MSRPLLVEVLPPRSAREGASLMKPVLPGTMTLAVSQDVGVPGLDVGGAVMPPSRLALGNVDSLSFVYGRSEQRTL